MPIPSPTTSQHCGMTGADSSDMNPYNPNGSRKVVTILLIISISLAGLIHTGLDAVNFELHGLAGITSAVGMYHILYYVFDRFIWKWRSLRKLGLVTVPDLNGQWGGKIKSSYEPDAQDYQICVFITQQWSKILVRLEAGESYSKSIAASFLTDDPSSPELVYVYDNDPEAMTPESMHPHSGTAKLRITDSGLQGQYYTGQGRRTIGDISLKRI